MARRSFKGGKLSQSLKSARDEEKKKKKSSSSSSSSKKIVIYDASGKVTQSNDPSKPVGMVDSSKKVTSALAKTPDYKGASVSFKRTGSTITEDIFRRGKKVSSRVVQDKSTPRGRRTTTSRLAGQVKGISQAQQSRTTKRRVEEAYRKINQGTATSKDKLFAVFGTDTPSLAYLNRILKNPEQRKQARQIFKVSQSQAINKVRLDRAKEEQLRDLKPVFNTGAYLRIMGYPVSMSQDLKLFTNSQGQVIGVRDPYLKQSYALRTPIPKETAEFIFQNKEIGKRFFESSAKLKAKLEPVRQKKIEEERMVAIQDQLGRTKQAELNKWYEGIQERSGRSIKARESFQKPVRSIINNTYKFSLLGVLTPKKADKWVKDALVGFGTIPYDFTVGFGRFIPEVIEKVSFQIKAVGGWNYTKEFTRRLFGGESAKEFLKSVDPRTPEGFVNLVMTLAIAKSIAKRRAIKVIERKSLPKTSKMKIGTVFKDTKGNYGVVTKGGKVFKVKANEIRRLVRAEQKGAKIRAKKTEVARITKKVKAGKELTLGDYEKLTQAGKKRYNTQLNTEINKLVRRYKLTGTEKAQFKKIYSEFRKKPTLTNARKLKAFESKVSVDQIVRAVDKRIASQLKPKVKRVTKFDKSVKELDAQILRLKKKKTTTKKAISERKQTIQFLEKQRKAKLSTTKKAKASVKSMKEQANVKAQRKGFKDVKEQATYNEAFRKYKDGNLKFESTLKRIESSMKGRKAKASKLASKKYEVLRKQVIFEAEKLLKEGRIKIQDKKYVVKVKTTKNPLSKQKQIELAVRVNNRLEKIDTIKYKRQAREVMKEILKGNEVDTSNPRLLSAIKQLINKEQLQLLRKERLLKIQAGQVKGKMPKVSVGKKAKTELKLKAKAETKAQRIARKKAKRSPAGLSQSRKIRRKQIVNELQREKAILQKLTKGDPNLANKYSISIDSRGNARLIPNTNVPKNMRVKTATQIVRKSSVPKGTAVPKSDGTIQILKTKKVTRAKLSPLEEIGIRRAELRKIWAKVGTKKATTSKTPRRTVTSRKPIRRTGKKAQLKQIPKLKVVKAPNVTTAILSARALVGNTKSTSKSATALAQKSVQRITQVQVQRIASAIRNDVKIMQDVISDIDTIVKSDITSKQRQGLRQAQRIAQKQLTELRTIQKKITSKKKPVSKKPLIEVKPKVKLSFNKPAPRGYSYIVQPYIKSRGSIRKLGKPTTTNRGIKRARDYADNYLVASMEVKIVGLRKVKDIKAVTTRKFRKKVSRDPKVLSLVEYNKYRFDKPKEKANIQRARKTSKKKR